MKIAITTQRQRQSGMALLITIIVLLFGATVFCSYLVLTEGEFNSVNRSQTWNNSLTLTESGVEDALAFMNKYAGNFPMIDQWSSDASAAEDGWTKSNTVYFVMHRVVDTNSGYYYDVTIDNTLSNAPVITCSGSAWTFSAAQSPFLLAAAGVSVSTPAIGRAVQVRAVYQALFTDAIDSVTNINLNGNNVRVDSFNSTNASYSDWNASRGYGTYNSSKARANGNVATDSSIIGAISVGQANVYGHVNTGPGGSTTVGNNGYVGPLPQNGSGIQTGYSSDDMNVIFPDVQLPVGAKNWQNIPENDVISASGNYYVLNLTDNLTISAPNVTIYVAGSISLSGSDVITISTNVNKVNIYVGGPSFSTTGNATINNLTQHATVLSIYGLPSLTSISFGGNAAYNGTIYAPEADFQFGGGGNNTYDFVGAIVVRSVKLNGHANFHYDECLATVGPGRGYVPSSWKEVTGN